MINNLVFRDPAQMTSRCDLEGSVRAHFPPVSKLPVMVGKMQKN